MPQPHFPNASPAIYLDWRRRGDQLPQMSAVHPETVTTSAVDPSESRGDG